MGISVEPYGPPLVSTKNRSKPWNPPVTHSSTATAVTFRIEPARVQFAAQPGQLALGQLPGGVHGAVAERRRVGRPVQVFPCLAVADRPQRRQVERARMGAQLRPRAQGAHLVEEAGIKHRIEPARDPRVPWYAKLLGLLITGYALSPIDLIPDFIPVLGLLDDLVLIPLGIWLMLRLIPAEVFAEHRATAEVASHRPVSRIGAAIVLLLWLAIVTSVVWSVWSYRYW